MEETRNLVLEIANRLYDLDAEVYRVLGSGLGRVFNASREESIRELTRSTAPATTCAAPWP